jgi:membrane associated rhomboid family serine protease
MDSLFASPVTMGLLALNIVASMIAFQSRSFMEQNTFWIEAIRDRSEWYRVFSAGFLHVAIWHLAFNMLTLYSLGPVMERVLGGIGLSIVYFAGLLGGHLWAYTQNRNDGDYRAIGASGAISGVILGFCLYSPFSLLSFFFVVPVWGIIAGPAIIVISYFLAKREDRIIGHEAHLGGAVAGVIATLLVRPETLGEFIAQASQRFG